MSQKKVKYKKRNPQPTPPAEKPVKKAKKKAPDKKKKPGVLGKLMVSLSESRHGKFAPYYILIFVVVVIGIAMFLKFYTPSQESAYNATLQFSEPAEDEEIAIINTSKGDIALRFFEKQAPKAVENFKTLAKQGFYDGLLFHRIKNNFMIQTGDPEGTGAGGQSSFGEAFEDEFNPSLLNVRGAVAMANAGPNTNKSQFFINQNSFVDETSFSAGLSEKIKDVYREHGGSPFLDGSYSTTAGHTVFAQVIHGMEVVDAIAAAEVEGEKPVEDILMNSITFIKYYSGYFDGENAQGSSSDSAA